MFFFRHKTIALADLGIQADNHCHLLPGVDDGVQTPEESIQILRDMADFGIKRITLTPHINPEIFKSDENSTIESYAAFFAKIPQDVRDRVDITIGAEYMVGHGFQERDVRNLLKFREGKILIEMSYYYPSNNMAEAVFNITSSGMVPVVAHPERYLYYADDLKQFDTLHDLGCEFQLNLLSTGGVYGKGSIRIMEYLMKNDWYTHIGTDTHTRTHFQKISKQELDPKIADGVRRILEKNPT